MRAIDTGLFAPQLIPFSPEASRAPVKIDQSREPPSISINCETPHHQNESTWENGWSCEDNLAANAAILFNREQAGKEMRASDQTVSFGEFAFTARSVSQVLDKTEQIKAVHLRAIAVKKKVSPQPTLTRWMIRDVGAHINAVNYQRTYFKLQMKVCVTEIQKKNGTLT